MSRSTADYPPVEPPTMQSEDMLSFDAGPSSRHRQRDERCMQDGCAPVASTRALSPLSHMAVTASGMGLPSSAAYPAGKTVGNGAARHTRWAAQLLSAPAACEPASSSRTRGAASQPQQLAPFLSIPSVSESLSPSAPAERKRLSPAMKDLLFGSIAGMCAKFFEHPFDLVKVRLQTQAAPTPIPAAAAAELAGAGSGGGGGAAASSTASPGSGPVRYTGAFDCFAKTIRNEGFLGLYRGLSMPIVGAIAENATLFFTYNFALRSIHSFAGSPAPLTRRAAKRKPAQSPTLQRRAPLASWASQLASRAQRQVWC